MKELDGKEIEEEFEKARELLKLKPGEKADFRVVGYQYTKYEGIFLGEDEKYVYLKNVFVGDFTKRKYVKLYKNKITAQTYG